MSTFYWSSIVVSAFATENMNVGIRLTDLSGKLVHQTTVNVVKGDNHFNYIPEGELSSGIYLLTLYTENGVSVTQKVIKQ